MPKRILIIPLAAMLIGWATARAAAQPVPPVTAPDAVTGALRSLTVTDARFQPALAAMETNNPDAAYRALATLLRDDPGNEAVNFAFGLMAVQRGRPSLGALAFERVLTINPNNDRARLELGRAYFLVGQWDRARRHFIEVLDRQPPDGVRDTVAGYLHQIRRYRRGWHVSGRIETGILYDSNVNYGPDSRNIAIAPLSIGNLRFDELRVAPGTARRAAWGGMAIATLRPTYTAWNADNLSFDSHLRFYANGLLNASDYAIAGFQVSAGPRWRRERQMLHIPLRIEHLGRGGDALATLAGLHPLLHYRITPAWSLLSGVSAELRRFSGDHDRDSLLAAVGEQVIYRFGHAGRHHAGGGLRLARETAQADIYSNTDLEANLRWHLQATAHQALFGDAIVRYRTYDEREPLAPKTRRDLQWGVSAGTARRLTAAWSCELTLQYWQNDSSFDLYDTTRFNATWSIIHEF